METRSGRLEFPPQSGSHSVVLRLGFDRPVLAVEVALAGYEARYTGGDHHVRQLTVDLRAEIGGRVDDGWELRLVGTLFLKDDDNNSFTGWIDYLLFVELGKVPVFPPVLDPLRDAVLEG
jgi:hypothetical protein